jgi:hypothetical protein
MTERSGGSDLSHTETSAKLVKESVSTERLGSQEWCLNGLESSPPTDGSLCVALVGSFCISSFDSASLI